MLESAFERKAEEARNRYAQSFREAYLCAIFTNLYRDPKKTGAVTVESFLVEYPELPKKEPERTVMTDEEIEATLKNFVYPILKAAEGGE